MKHGTERERTWVFLHYFGGAAGSWQWLLEELPSSIPTLCLDLPGFGRTEAFDHPSIEKYSDFVLRQLDVADIQKCILIGHSMGAKIALQTASKDTKNRIEEIILIAPSPPTTEPLGDAEKREMLNHPDRASAEKSVRAATVAPLDDAKRSYAVSTQLLVVDSTWRWWIFEGMNHSILPEVHSLKVPIHVIASKDDPVIRQETIQQEVLEKLPIASTQWVEGTGHLIPIEVPALLAQKLQQALRL